MCKAETAPRMVV